MIERTLSLRFPPGIYRNGTRLQAKGRWYDAHLMRWIERDVLAPLGGWLAIDGIALTGIPRAAHAWAGADGTGRLGVGTVGATSKAYSYSSGAATDITPAGLAASSTDGSRTGGAYGSGSYGTGPYGSGTGGLDITDADTWSLDNFGDYLVACLTSDGKIWYWDANPVNDLVQATDSPTGCRAVVVTPERFLVALGASSNRRLVKWATQEGGLSTSGDWTISSATTAGDFELMTLGEIITGRRARRNTLIWTNADLHAMTYIGGTFVYSFERVADNCGIIGPNAVAMVDGAAYWMSHGRFFMYDGAVRPIECDVLDYVFGRLKTTQRAKIVAVPNSQYSEVTWFYPSSEQEGLENDSYVTYNYQHGFWMIGNLGRAAGSDAGVFEYPMLLKSDGTLYEHERGDERSVSVSVDAGPPIVRTVVYDTPYIESAPMELGEGDQLGRVQRIIPDERTVGQMQATFYVANAPTDTETSFGPYNPAQPTDVRFTGRQVRIRLAEATAGQNASWRVGLVRLGVIPAGRR